MVDEPEVDRQVNKKFLRMRANEDKTNFRSPFTGVLWPSNTKTYTVPRNMELERDLNVFLGQFQKLYYVDGVVSGYVKEFKDKEVTLNIGAFRKKEEKSDHLVVSCSYKVFFAASVSQTDSAKANTVSLRQNSVLTYSLHLEFPQLQERTSFSGQLTSQNNKSEFDHNDNLNNDYVVELVGNQFERSDNRLRFRLHTLLADVLARKTAAFAGARAAPASVSAINDDLRKIQARFLEDEKLTTIPIKVLQGS